MSVTKRLWDLARSNLSDFRSAFDSDLMDGLSEEDRRALDEELKKNQTVGAKAGRTARRVKDAAEEAWEKAYEKAKQRGPGGPSSAPSSAEQRRRWYKTLELEPGADFDAIRKSYRRLLRQYHPDKFAQDPEKYRAATEVARNITEAYNGLADHLGEK